MSTFDSRMFASVADTFAAAAILGFKGSAPVYVAGSLRRVRPPSAQRGEDTGLIGDIDLIVVDNDHEGMPALVQGEFLTTVTEKKASGWLELPEHGRMMIDAWVCPVESLGPFAFFLTGPVALNAWMRAASKSVGLMLTQYGLFEAVSKPTKTYPHRLVTGERLDPPSAEAMTPAQAEKRFWENWTERVGMEGLRFPWPHERDREVWGWLPELSRATRSGATSTE